MAFSIFGFLNVEDQKVDEIVQRMFEALASRGGGSKTVHSENNLVMGVRGDADYVKKALVMNPAKSIIAAIEGEIYNFEEIKHMLGDEIELENVFETVVALYEKFGKDFPRYLNGIFTIALWDKNQKRLYLVRDHLGSHSLFYTKTNDSLFFATTLQSLLNTGYVKREISPRAMAMYFAATAISPPHTMLKDVYCLRPGSLVMYNVER